MTQRRVEEKDRMMEWEVQDETAIEGGSTVEPGTVFHYINPRNPLMARRRVGAVYWKGWRRLVMSFFLFIFGVTFVIIGAGCIHVCTDWDRGVAFFFIGCLILMPGCYGMVTLAQYVRGKRGFSYQDLPEFEW